MALWSIFAMCFPCFSVIYVKYVYSAQGHITHARCKIYGLYVQYGGGHIHTGTYMAIICEVDVAVGWCFCAYVENVGCIHSWSMKAVWSVFAMW